MKNYLKHNNGFTPQNFSKRNLGGFTLVELLVTISIFGILSTVILANYKGYNTNAVFANTVEDIILSLREAQVYGVSTKGNVIGPTSYFDLAYGVYFTLNDNNHYIQFVDIAADKLFNPSYLPTEKIKTVALPSPITIQAINCRSTSGFTFSCPQLHISFKRPSPDAVLRGYDASTPPTLFQLATTSITLGNGSKTATININRAGLIELQ